MRILVYHGKHGDEYWVAGTKAQLNDAKRTLFKHLDNGWRYSFMSGPLYQMLKKAREGDIRAVTTILRLRNGIPDETWEVVTAMTPPATPPVRHNLIGMFLRAAKEN